MKTIYRYEFEVDDRVTIVMPKGARILSVLPSDRLTYGVALWAIVDTDAETEPRYLLVRGTGHPLTEWLGRFVGTVSHGPLVWHVFEPAPVAAATTPSGVPLHVFEATPDADPPE